MAKVNEFLGYTVVVKVWDHVPAARDFMYYDDALEYLNNRMEMRQPYEKAVGCIMNAQLNHICFTTEVGPDEK
ncbi:MAG: hypothetical protein J6W65_06715 [Oscillospiraceae bacterium]|nr:hypothetical protein [Oscillospiraceae bacterium]MBP5444285.1 hypothetical protein [Treponema sp.]MBQ5337115.1 hypothetical protein [Oscillospiraceae bacterium]